MDNQGLPTSYSKRSNETSELGISRICDMNKVSLCDDGHTRLYT